MKKLKFLIAAFLFANPFCANAQFINDDAEEITLTVDDEDDDEDEDLEDDNGDNEEIDLIVTDNHRHTPEYIGDIELPEGMSDDIDSLLNAYNNQAYLRIDESCNFPNFNPEFSEDVYKERLQKLPTLFELPYNDVVRQFIDRYTNRLRRQVGMMVGASNFYMPIFEEALESYGLPLELKYLPIIESALNPRAVSPVGAGGLWQFMPATGKMYDLEINSLVDERRDPIKSSYAAAHYLSDLYKIFGDWNLVIAAYNCGPGNINKAIHRAGGARDYWTIYPYLPRETRGYVPAFIAANYVMNYYCEHNICPMLTELPAKTDTIMLSRDVHFEQISKVLNIDIREIQELNPQYRQNIVNGTTKPSVLKLKAQDIIAFIDNQDSIFAYDADRLINHRAVVAVRDDSYSGNRSYKSKSTSSKKAKSTSSKKKSSKKSSSKKSSGKKTATIKKGDTLSSIAKRNGTTVAKLKQLNPNIKGTTIHAGKTIRVK